MEKDSAVPPTTVSSNKTHPLFIGAAIGVLLFSMVGIAALTGVLPLANSQKDEQSLSVAAKDQAKTHRAVADVCAECGAVESVRAVEVKGEGTGLGGVAGGVAGAVVGNQMGKGNGNTAMTILGAAGGAYAGNEIEKNVKKHVIYRVTVRMEDGSYRTVSQAAPAAVGEKVRIANGHIISRS